MKKIFVFACFVVGIAFFFASTADASQVCPEGNGWVKYDNLSGYEFTVIAPQGFLIAESCYKAADQVRYEEYDPAVEEITIKSEIINPGGKLAEISHLSIRFIEIAPTPTPTKEVKVTITPQETPEETPATETPVVGTETPENPTETPGTGTETPENPTETPGIGTETPENPTETPGIGTETPETPTPSETPGKFETEIDTGGKNPVVWFILGGLVFLVGFFFLATSRRK